MCFLNGGKRMRPRMTGTLLLLLFCLQLAKGAIREEVKSKAGATVDLPCVINTPNPLNSNGELVGLPTVSAHIPLQHHNMSYMRPYRHNNQAAPPPPPQYNSHYRGQTMQHHRGVGGVGHPSD